MDLFAGSHTLGEGIVTYRTGNDYFIHFASFLQAVEFPIQRQGRMWSGWFRSQESRFTWNMDDGQVRTAGDAAVELRNARWIESDEGSFTRVVENPQWIETDEGTFVSLAAIESWFELGFTTNPLTQSVAVTSARPLPFEQRLTRVSAKNSFRPDVYATDGIPVPDHYRWFTLPLVDLSVNHRTWNGASGTRSDSTQTTLTASLDLLKHAVVYAGAAGGNSDADRQRLTMQRSAATSTDTLLLGANRYTFGDIFATHSNLVNAGGDGVGFRVERRRNGRGSGASLLTVTGDATPGWDAELYRNGVLITFGAVGPDGRYVFPDQETVYGENVFLVRLFGPQGEIEERRHVFWGGGIELAKGDYSYSVSHIDFSRRFLDGERPMADGLASSQTSDIRFARALTDNLQLGAAYTLARLGSRAADGRFTETRYAALEGRMNMGNGLLLTELVKQQDEGGAWAVNYLTTVNAQNLSLSHQSFDDYESPYTVRRIALDAENRFTLSGPLDRFGLDNYTLRFTHQDRADGLHDYRLFNRLGARWGRAVVSNDLEYLRAAVGDSFYRGRLRVSGRRDRLNFRGQLDYNTASVDFLTQVSATVGWTVGQRTHTRLTVRRLLNDARETYVETQSTFQVGAVGLFVNASAGTDDSWSVTMGISSRFGYDPGSTEFFSADHSLAGTGRARLRLFLDSNNNGLWEPGEDPIQQVAYRNQTASTSASGVLQLTGIPADTALRVDTRHFRFDDPFLSPGDKAYELYTHAGSDIDVHIPVVLTGDVEGYLLPGTGMNVADVQGIPVVLYDTNGDELATTRSEFDGYYAFSGIPVGHYEVAVIPYADKPGYQLQRFSLDAEDNYRMLEPIHLWKR